MLLLRLYESDSFYYLLTQTDNEDGATRASTLTLKPSVSDTSVTNSPIMNLPAVPAAGAVFRDRDYTNRNIRPPGLSQRGRGPNDHR
jgi:hypothetical protein